MIYRISADQRHLRFLDIRIEMTPISMEPVQLQLPAWRPGRYELANYAAQVREWQASTADGQILSHCKLTKDCWEVSGHDGQPMVVAYRFYCEKLDAGSTWVDEEQVYVNPVNCMLYQPEMQNAPCKLQVDVPADYQIAIGWPEAEKNCFEFPDFHTLADSPLIASASLQHSVFEYLGVNYHLWFQGECQPDAAKLETDFKAFIKVQLDAMGSLPIADFHFLFQIRPHAAYHGVEHVHSTVILLGPGYGIFKDKAYEDLLGVSSHELFHVWNVKTIRPQEMMPYRYAEENYSPLGLVAEGVTTYYGDLFLARAGLYSTKRFLELLSQQIQRHWHNFARTHKSMAESSEETWLDGYRLGVPHRKLSIYSDGCVLATIADLRIRAATSGEKSLDDVMRQLYEDFGKPGLGYSLADYQSVLETVSGSSFADYFEELVWGTGGFGAAFADALQTVGCEVIHRDLPNFGESRHGFKASESGTVITLFPNGPAEQEGLAPGDKVLAVNGISLDKNLHEWLDYFQAGEVKLAVSRNRLLRQITLPPVDENRYFQEVSIQQIKDPSPDQQASFKRWIGAPEASE